MGAGIGIVWRIAQYFEAIPEVLPEDLAKPQPSSITRTPIELTSRESTHPAARASTMERLTRMTSCVGL
jgi:hypothetical protein